MAKFFKEKKSPWFLRKASDDAVEGFVAAASPAANEKYDQIAQLQKSKEKSVVEMPGNSSRLQKDQKQPSTSNLKPTAEKEDNSGLVERRVGLVFRLVLVLSLILLPFYFLPPLFTNFNFYLWREIAVIVLALLLLSVFVLKILVTQTFAVLKNHTFNTFLGLTVLALFLNIFFSSSRILSLTSLSTWSYLAWVLILFITANNLSSVGLIGPIRPLKKGLLKIGVLLSLTVVILVWALPFTPLLSSLPSQVTNNLQKPTLLDLRTSWHIAIESFQNRPLTGFGPGLFEESFQLYKPNFFNQNSNFNLIFYQSHWPFLGTLTTQGLLAVLLWGAVVALMYKLYKSDNTHTVVLSTETSRISSAVLIALMIVAGALLFRVINAELTFTKALAQFNEGQVGLARQTMGEAINQNIYEDHYRRVYISLSRSMVDLIAQQNADEQGQVSESASNDIRTLVNQNVAQSRILTENINPLDARNWAVRGDTYRELIGVGSGAENWALGAYQQAVQLAPTNPFLRISLGGVFLTLGNSAKVQANQIEAALQAGTPITFNEQNLPEDQARALQKQQSEQAQTWLEQAAEQFRLAVVLKNDFPNAYYNWAAALNLLDRKNQARAALEQTLALVEKDSPDYEQVKADLERIQEELGIKVTSPEEQQSELQGGGEVTQPEGEVQLPEQEEVLLPTPTVTPTLGPTRALLPTFTPAP